MIGTFIAKMKIRSAFEALNNGDFPTFSAAWRDDCVFIYPGDIAVSGRFEGREAIEKWFKHFMEQFPKMNFTLKNVCVGNLLDMVGTNTVIAEWDLEVTNREGKEVQNSGTTTIDIKFGRATYVKDYVFDTGAKWREGWGAE